MSHLSKDGDPSLLHGRWSTLLRRHVSHGFVDYAGMKKNSQAALDGYLSDLAAVNPERYERWSAAETLAFWINAYNAYTIKLVLDHHPLKSIRSIGFLPMAAFRKAFIPLAKLRGRKLSLNDIEHNILRKEFQEPRIHFAIVCASKSCPILQSEAFVGADLERQLQEATQGFITDSSKNFYDEETHTLRLSPIFKWFRQDFDRAPGGLLSFVMRNLPQREGVNRPKLRIKYLAYDWSLNGA